ncbi:MAG: hypothetical protein AAF564_12595 [Bacteroidota bacterium]
MRTLFLALLCFGLLLPANSRAQETHIHGFTDFSFVASNKEDSKSAFQLGEYVLYVVSDLSDRISFLGETTFEYHDGFEVDVERVAFRYHLNNYLNFEIGKHHTPLGYWNTSYHHGTVLQPTVGRPIMLSFENRGGIMPIHTVGVSVWGNLPSGIYYEFMLGNGIGSTARSDNDESKSLAIAFHKDLNAVLRVGITGYFDRIAAGLPSFRRNDAGRIPLAASVRQQSVGGNARFKKDALELLGEVMLVSNRSDLGDGATLGHYIYGGYQLGKVTPYVRFDQLIFEDSEPYFLAEDANQFLMGLRFDLNFLAVIRLEYQTIGAENADTIGRFVFQVALGF